MPRRGACKCREACTAAQLRLPRVRQAILRRLVEETEAHVLRIIVSRHSGRRRDDERTSSDSSFFSMKLYQ